MTKHDLKAVKAKILEEIDKTSKSVEDYREMTSPISPENTTGRVSWMDATNNKSVAETALLHAEEKLKNLNYVLSSIDEPDFGICINCQKPIPIGRILLMPQSRYCVNCAS